jgi:hypothetical protein
MTHKMLKVHVNGSYPAKHPKFFNLNFRNLKIMSGFVLCRRPTKVRTAMNDSKIVAFHQNRVLAYQILPKNTNVNFEVYLSFLFEVLHRETNTVLRPLILHVNATPHKHR